MRTQVCITIDTEFSIAGAFADTALRPVAEPMVYCDVDGQSQGLGFMLETFRQTGVTATFFVEALHRYYFSDDPMRPAVRQIEAAGHELQLHAHPCWSVFQHDDWQARVRAQPRQDDFAGRPVADSAALIAQGIANFKDWGLPLPTVFRSGSLQHDDNLYQAIAHNGMPFSSNVGLAIYDSGDERYRLYAGRHARHGVVECPVLTFADWQVGSRRHLKTLTIAGTSFAETRLLLDQAQRAGVPLVVILTHPFEYVQSADLGRAPVRTHAVNQGRLQQLCRYLAAHGERFAATGLGAASVPAPDELPGAPANPVLQGGLLHSVVRMATQVGYDRYGNWALGRSKPNRTIGNTA